jgi:hypothetical protein
VAELDGLLRFAPDAARRRLLALRLDPAAPPDYRGITPHVLPSGVWAMYAALGSPDDWVGAVTTAIAGAGDTDTTGAMAGALVGARIGIEALPPAARAVHDRGRDGYEALLAVVRLLDARAGAP